MKLGIPALLLISLLFAAPASAQSISNLSTAEVKNFLDQKQSVLLVDTRTAQEFSEGHLPTALNIPPQQFRAIHNHLPQDKDLPLVFYCRGYN